MPSPDENARQPLSQPTGTDSTHQSGNASVSVFRRVLLDQRISHGAFRLFCYLQNRKNGNGQVWPKQSTISSDIGCKERSLTSWTMELVTAGYIGVERVGQNHNYLYTILNGDEASFVLPNWAVRAAHSRPAQKGGANKNLVPPKKEVEPPIGDAPRPAQKGGVSGSKVVSSLSGGGNFPRLEKMQGWQLRKDLRESTDPAEREAIKAEMQRRKGQPVKPKAPASRPTPAPAANQKQITQSPELAAKFREMFRQEVEATRP